MKAVGRGAHCESITEISGEHGGKGLSYLMDSIYCQCRLATGRRYLMRLYTVVGMFVSLFQDHVFSKSNRDMGQGFGTLGDYRLDQIRSD